MCAPATTATAAQRARACSLAVSRPSPVDPSRRAVARRFRWFLPSSRAPCRLFAGFRSQAARCALHGTRALFSPFPFFRPGPCLACWEWDRGCTYPEWLAARGSCTYVSSGSSNVFHLLHYVHWLWSASLACAMLCRCQA
jgi:hypothetical protein